ncbi:hypothetical protein [Pararhizobium gei]|uniref:hypothetical protein n=1 Tax=Pararhizobium gei TaxID=1395951 RepID=UPI0023DB075A|nr:hypothetical protein [Rhizobium gei]
MTGKLRILINNTQPGSPMDVATVLANPELLAVLQVHARHMIGIFDLFPRVARLTSAQQKWLLTQATYALHLQRDPADPSSGITASRLLDWISQYGAASRNTTTAFLAELLAYKLVRDIPGLPSGRSRPLEPTETGHEAMKLWFRGQMHSLDLLDDGGRVSRLEANPAIFSYAQPSAARKLIADSSWREPPPSVSCFVWTEYGGMILDDLVSRITHLAPAKGRYSIGDLHFSELSSHYSLSPTHIRRLFSRALELGHLGGNEKSTRGRSFWATESFIEDYKRWQSVKFSALDHAFHEALAAIEGQRSDCAN